MDGLLSVKHQDQELELDSRGGFVIVGISAVESDEEAITNGVIVIVRTFE